MPTPIKTPREILMEIRQYEMDCGCVDENCPSCAKIIDQALQALDAYYRARVRVDKGEILKIFAKNSRLIGGYAQFYGITDLEFDKIANEIVSHSTQIIKIEGER